MRSELFGTNHAEAVTSQPGMALQNSKMLKVALNGEVIARQGSMVAYQGQVDFEALGSGGITRYVTQRLTGEGIPLMRATGRGEVFLADLASDVFVIDLDGPNDGLTINGRNVLAFEPSLRWDIHRVQGAGFLSSAGLFNCVFTGQGRIAITCKGHAGRPRGRPAHLRRPAGGRLLVGGPADRVPPRRPDRPGHAARAHHG